MIEHPTKYEVPNVKQIQLSTDCKSQKSDYKTPVKTFLSVANKVYT